MRPTTESLVLERDPALAELDAVFRRAGQRRGGLAMVEGPAGEGKSTLLALASERAAALGLTVLRARGSELEREFPFGVMRQIFEPVLARAGPDRRELLLAGAAAPAAPALDLGLVEGAERVSEGQAALHALYWLTSNLASTGPLALVVDDAHWADASSLRALDYLARRIADLPVALVVALRPAEPDAPGRLLEQLLTAPDAARVPLRPLGPESVARIVRSRLPASDDAACEAANAATAGNPLYLQELLRAARVDPAADPAEGRVDLARLAIPSLGDRVLRRTRRVAPEAGDLARQMAVLGDGERLEVAAALAGVDLATAGRIAHRLRRIEVLAAEDPFRFVHPLVRRSVYDAMSVTERDAAHGAAADALAGRSAPVEAVAAHLAAITPAGSVRVATAVVAAGRRALAHAAPDEAVRWFERALTEGAPAPPPAAITNDLGLSLAALRDGRAIDHLRRALDESDDHGLQARTASALADILVLAGRWSEAHDTVATYRRRLEGDDEALAQLAAVELMVGFYSTAAPTADDLDRERVRRLADGDSWAAHALAAALAVIAAHRGERPERVLELVDRALADGVLEDAIAAPLWPASNAMVALVDVDEYERALAVSDRIGERARRQGSLSAQMAAIDHRGWMHARRGDLAAAEADLRANFENAHAAGMGTVAATQLFYLQEPISERPGLDDIAELALTLDLGPGAEGTWPSAALAASRGRIRLARRETAEGLEDLRQAVASSDALGIGPTVWPVRSLLALALARTSPDEADRLVRRELEWARATGLARPIGVALRTAGMLETGERRLSLLHDAAELLSSSPARLEHARALVALGSALRRQQRRADSRAPLREGLRLALACGATRLADRAGQELRATGAHMPRELAVRRRTLTASELRVARLAADGATNPEIGQELFVSLKTVETHLSHAYAKLGLSGRGSRTRLAEALREAAPDEGEGPGERR